MTPVIVVSTLACFAISGAVTNALLSHPPCLERKAPYRRRRLSNDLVLVSRCSRPRFSSTAAAVLQSIPAIEQQLDASLTEVSKSCGFPACSRSFPAL